jgi:hypothetical protein
MLHSGPFYVAGIATRGGLKWVGKGDRAAYGGVMNGARYTRPMEVDPVIARLRDASQLEQALAELGLDVETIRLVADLAPSRGITAFAVETSACVG